MKPKHMTRSGDERITIVAFKYDKPNSIFYGHYSNYETVASKVQEVLNSDADVISIRRVYSDREVPREAEYSVVQKRLRLQDIKKV